MSRIVPFLTRAGRKLSLWIVPGGALAIPLVFLHSGKDAFRVPKEIVFQGLALALIAAICLWAVEDGFARLFEGFPRRFALILALTIVWTLVATIASDEPRVSLFAFGHVLLAIAWFLGAWLAGRHHGTILLLPVIAAGAANALIGVLQAHDLWSPFELNATNERAEISGLMGNPNDLGGLLVAAVLAVALLIRTSNGGLRAALALSFALMAYGIFVTQSATALISIAVGLIAMVLATVRRGRWIGSIAIIAILLLGTLVPLTTGRLLDRKLLPLVEGEYAELLSGRQLAYATAVMMVATDPLTGVGPGCFAMNYSRLQILAYSRNPEIASKSMKKGVFVEVHNDHLEIAAETGIPGLILELAAFGALLIPERNPPLPHGGLDRLGRLGIWGLAASLFVQMTFNFPMQLTGILSTYLYLGGIFAAWRSR